MLQLAHRSDLVLCEFRKINKIKVFWDDDIRNEMQKKNTKKWICITNDVEDEDETDAAYET